MGNFLIMNNVNSNTITGLLIQNLPPITKPRQRVNIEEIDGRDGDIITPLGYGAYDKEFQIGLSHNYDINEIIKYFDSEGTVTFSNEPDKYYNYKIIEQIDYEKLIRFKTANVKMHVQPFKYATNEEPIVAEFEEGDDLEVTVTNSGNIYSKPTITIQGSGDISVYLDNSQVFEISLGNEEYIVIDVNLMEAYKGNTLKNRLVTGNYDNFILPSGNSTISFQGTVQAVEVRNYSRWI